MRYYELEHYHKHGTSRYTFLCDKDFTGSYYANEKQSEDFEKLLDKLWIDFDPDGCDGFSGGYEEIHIAETEITEVKFKTK